MILVVGASGLLGFEICRTLRARGAAVRALVRAGSIRKDDLAALGAEIAMGDLKDAPTLETSCRGIDVVVTTANSLQSRRAGDNLQSVDRDGQLALLEAARRAGVRRFLYLSAPSHLRTLSEFLRIKRLVEREVRGSGLEWIILQPAGFMEVWFSPALGFDLAGGRARIVGTGDHAASFVSIVDVAKVAGEAAARPELARRDLPIGGPEAISPNEVVRLAEAVTGRRFKIQRVPVAALKLVRAVLSPFAPIPASLLSLAIETAENGGVLDTTSLWRDLGLTPTTVRGFLEAAARPR
jgi:uncharacterized protein YbjT (DUF2867 family)